MVAVGASAQEKGLVTGRLIPLRERRQLTLYGLLGLVHRQSGDWPFEAGHRRYVDEQFV